MSVRDTPLLIYYPGVGMWHSDPHILSWYRNVAPDPYTILVSERDTPILIYYPGTGTWHPIHILSWCRNVTLRSSYTILVPECGTRSIYYPGVGTWHSDPHSILVPERGTRSPNSSSLLLSQGIINLMWIWVSFKILDSITSSCLFHHNHIIIFMQAYN